MKTVHSLTILVWAMALGACSSVTPDAIIQNGVESQIRDKGPYTKACFESEYRKEKVKPEGYVVLRMTLNEDGDVRNVETVEDQFHNERLENCLKYIVKTIRFDRSGVTMDTFVDYPFVFRNPVENYPK